LVAKAFCEEGNLENNGVLSFVKFVLFPLYSLKGIDAFVIKRPAKFGGDITFHSYEEVEKAFVEKTLYPLDLKAGVTDALNSLLEPIRQKFTDKALIALTNAAYPEQAKKTDGAAAAPATSSKDAKATTSTSKDAKAAPQEDVLPVQKLDFRVGLIKSVKRHPDAEALYVEEIDIGEEKPRQVVSGLVRFMPESELQDRLVVLLCNLKPAK